MEAPDLTFRHCIPIIPRAVCQAGPVGGTEARDRRRTTVVPGASDPAPRTWHPGPAAPPVTQPQPTTRPSVSSCQDSALHDDTKADIQGMAGQITDQMLDERVDERAGAHRPPDPVEPYPPPRSSKTAPPTGFPRPCAVFPSTPGPSAHTALPRTA